MAEEFGDKTEAPTPRRREEAREQGQVARSPDLAAAGIVIGILIMLDWYGFPLVRALTNVLQQMLGTAALSDRSPAGISMTLLTAVQNVAVALAPLLVGIVIIGIAVNVAQVGLMFNTKRLAPNLAALNPAKGFKRLFGGGQGFVQFGMNLLKTVAVAVVGYSAVHGRIGQIIAAQKLEFIQIFGLAASLVYSIVMRIGILLLILAILDYAIQRYRMERKLKMTKQEVKDEMKRMEGDPRLKARRRQIAIQMVTQRFRKDVPTADVIVTNPTEFAIAIKYDADSMSAPKVVAKGQGYLALKIREIAIAHGIPILERKPLARALYKLVDVGQEIPEQFYSAVAEILAYVYELSGKARRSAVRAAV